MSSKRDSPFTWLIASFTRSQWSFGAISFRTWLFLGLSGLATGLSLALLFSCLATGGSITRCADHVTRPGTFASVHRTTQPFVSHGDVSPEGGTEHSAISVAPKSIARALAEICGQPVAFIVRRTRFEAGESKRYEQLLEQTS